MNDTAADNLEAPLAGWYHITRVIADTAADPIITIDEKSMMIFVNRATEEIFGYRRAELLGQSLTMLMPDCLRHLPSAGLHHEVESGQWQMPQETVALMGLHQSGEEIPLELSLGEFTENGHRFVTGIARDITERHRLVADRIALAIDNARRFEEERTARREAEAANRAKDEFLTTISHELRTPLTPIIGWIHMIRDGILPEKETLYGLSVIERNAHALKHLIKDLLDMSAILSGKMRMEELPVPLDSVVREAVDTVRPLAATRDIDVNVEFREWRNGIVTGDRARLVQVFWNLLDNAIKFSSPGGRVLVDAEANDGEAVVIVRDAGQGITPDFLPFVFERFRQADGSKTRLHGGLGLGLALVKSLVEAHNGKVEAESDGAGQGSLFRVRLPLLRDQPEAGQQSVHLMIVEDDLDTLEMLRATLEARGFRVTACESAAQTLEAALEVAAANRVDLIISDIGMPEMDGFQMIRRLREMPGYEDVPAIALSGYASPKDARTALAAGFNAHVSKPVDSAELIIMVNALLHRIAGAQS